eukprot:TRINITY_DN2103_c0_g1_i4.p1 TRINITY_DN2103_c0_g1~~TRINITY_DN2103_c0_g1_i4.p1  ORF type:complete len:363 (-),score=58.27 TRINITY_DN2103_c0_g1_i4:52-1140(-)
MYESQKGYHHLNRVATALQSIARKNQVQSWYRDTYRAALVIQAHVKRDNEVHKFQQLQRASVVLQTCIRSSSQRSAFIKFKRNLIVVQSVVRRRLVKRNMRDLVLTRLMHAREHLLRLWAINEESLFRKSMFMIAYSEPSLASLFACQEEARRLERSTTKEQDKKLLSKNILLERELLYHLLKVQKGKVPNRASIGGSPNINQLFLDWGVDPTSKKRKRKLLAKVWNYPELLATENPTQEIKSPSDPNAFWGRCLKSAQLVVDLVGVTKKFADFAQTRGISNTVAEKEKGKSYSDSYIGMKGGSKGKEKMPIRDQAIPTVVTLEGRAHSPTINSGLPEFNVLVENTKRGELAKHRSAACKNF